VAGRLQEAGERHAVKRLLVEPAGEEGRHVRVIDGAGGEERAQIHDRVALDVLHVPERADGSGGKGMRRNGGPVDGREVQRARSGHVHVEVEPGGHDTFYYAPSPAPGWPAQAAEKG
jgi:hypothetical protein